MFGDFNEVYQDLGQVVMYLFQLSQSTHAYRAYPGIFQSGFN